MRAEQLCLSDPWPLTPDPSRRGTLVRETRNGLTTDLVLDEQATLPRVLAAIRRDGYEELYAYGPEGLHAQRTITGTTDTLSYALLDAQGSLKQLTDTMGAVTLTRVYDAWGKVRFTAGTGTSRLGSTGEWQDGNLVYLRARWYHTGLGTFTSRDSFQGVADRPQSLHRYGYAENRPSMLVDPSGHSVDEYGHWMPCTMLPGRADSCSAQDYRDWWDSDSGDTFRRFSITTVTDVGSALASIPDIPYQILTNPQGVIWGILYGPIGVVENAVGGFVCGDPEKLGHVASSYGLFVVGGVLHSISDGPPPKKQTPSSKSGAGGKWPTIDEKLDPSSVKQCNGLACGPAAGEMVLKDRGIHIDQQAIMRELGELPTDASSLAQALNTFDNSLRWQGGYVGQNVFNALNKRGSWIAQMKEHGKRLEHFVVVDGVDTVGRIKIRDPWEGTSYLMLKDDFFKAWQGIACFKQ